MDEIRIRPATLRDLSDILRHRRAMFHEMGSTDEEALARMAEAGDRYFRDALPGGTYRGWMAETPDGRVVSGGGVAIVPWPGSPEFPATHRGWILNIYTEPEYRHRGIARKIMEAIVEWCRAEGFVHVSLHASQYGRRLYESMGFEPTNEMRMYLK